MHVQQVRTEGAPPHPRGYQGWCCSGTWPGNPLQVQWTVASHMSHQLAAGVVMVDVPDCCSTLLRPLLLVPLPPANCPSQQLSDCHTPGSRWWYQGGNQWLCWLLQLLRLAP